MVVVVGHDRGRVRVLVGGDEWGSMMAVVAGNEWGRIGPAARAREGASEGGGREECQG